MALIIKTSAPEKLLNAIKKAIDNGEIETWSYDADGDFTHTPEQWRNKAWLRPKTYIGELRFGLLGREKTKVSKPLYGVYHGRFIEMLLAHFDSQFSAATATASKTELDDFT